MDFNSQKGAEVQPAEKGAGLQHFLLQRNGGTFDLNFVTHPPSATSFWRDKARTEVDLAGAHRMP